MKAEYASIDQLKPLYGLGRTLVYELLNKNELRARKVNRKTLVELRSVDEFLERQPAYGKVA